MVRTIMLVVLVCCLLLLFSSFGGRFGLFHQLTLESLGPAQQVVTSVTNNVREIWNEYLSLFEVRKENLRLQKEISEYQKDLSTYYEDHQIVEDLKRKLAFKEKERTPLAVAKVVGKDPAYWFQTIVVKIGQNDGVMNGMVAQTEKGVVGQVIQVAPHYAKILLANAPSSAIDAIVQKNRVRGILKGAGTDGYTLNYVLKNADVVVGDRVVTAGIGGLFPSGILLGEVAAVHKQQRGMFQEIVVRPSVDFQTLELVFIYQTEKLSWQKELKEVETEK